MRVGVDRCRPEAELGHARKRNGWCVAVSHPLQVPLINIRNTLKGGAHASILRTGHLSASLPAFGIPTRLDPARLAKPLIIYEVDFYGPLADSESDAAFLPKRG